MYHETKKTYKVFIDHIYQGAQWMEGTKEIIYNPEIVWSGSGGYWHRADINDCIIANDFINENEFKV
jgi:hypothetical protein